MRTKSAKKRQEIVEVAAQLFREVGYERTSMDDILARVGRSKATLYNYFPSKETLFLEVVFAPIEQDLQAVYSVLDGPLDDIVALLLEFGRRALTLAFRSDVMAAQRLTVTEGNRFDIGPRGYKLAYLPSLQRVAGFMSRAMQAGYLRQADPVVAAQQLSALLEADWVQRVLYCVNDVQEEGNIEANVQRAVGAFLAIYRS